MLFRSGSFDGHARVHKRKRRAANARLRGRTVGAEYFAHGADCIREFFFVGYNGLESAFGECAVTYLAASRTAKRTSLARAIRREIVMVHITLKGFFVEVIELLNLGNSAERASRHCLTLTAGEHRRTVNARQYARFAPNIADIRELSSVGTNALFEYLRSEERRVGKECRL